ncbi:MAG: hypothetical protein COC19_03950 [SAR86 cluster bacterium]|uniref:PspA/IM30 family protein n=1 Tax=SAR86 cluster bacterium TaxID=2030880 RepID=A0A2A4MQ53_9GAMM|nr:MAG: hypothetical protein COC19_03950 [SAR86 cluster bacterium]
MSIFKDIVTAIRGGASEAGEAIVDSQALRILEQEIRDAENGIREAKSSLSKLKASEISLRKDLNIVNEDIADYTASARSALEKGNRELAVEIASKIQDLTVSKTDLDERSSMLDEQVNRIHKVIVERQKQVEKNKIELQKAKTYRDLQKTQKTIAGALPSNDSSAKRVQRALDRVQKKQSDFDNKQEADQWLSDLENGSQLDDKIKAAGIGEQDSSANSILDEIEASMKK